MKFSQFLVVAAAMATMVSCCSTSSVYREAPSGLIDEAKPLYLAYQFLEQGDFTKYKMVLSKHWRKYVERESRIDPKFLINYRKSGMNDYSDRYTRKYYTLSQWRQIEPSEAPNTFDTDKLATNQQFVITSAPPVSSGSSVARHSSAAVVVFEDGYWRLDDGLAGYRPQADAH